MTNFSEDETSVRVDFFKESGKWYCTEAVSMAEHYNESYVQDAVLKSVVDHVQGRLKGMTFVCLEPSHKHAFPVMGRVP